MQHIQQRIEEQFKGVLNTPDVLLNQQLLPYPNLKINTNQLLNFHISEANLVELNKHAYLGKRVELFVKQWIENLNEAELLAFSLQIIKDKITLGEFDFIWKYQEKLQHTELVYKQYIFDRNLSQNDLECWVGPNKKDFLHWKLKKLSEKQFPLLHQPATKEVLSAELNLKPADLQQNLCFKAQLYLHYKESKLVTKGLNENAVVGNWYYFNEFTSQEFNYYQFVCLAKQDWPILPKNLPWLSWLSFQEIVNEISVSIQNQRSVKLWMKTPQQIYQMFVIW